MTELLAHQDSYLKNFEASVVAIDADQNAIALDKTAFYPGGGGQPCDVGHIRAGGSELEVTKVKRQGAHIWHWVEGGLPEVGTSVSGAIDWGPSLPIDARSHGDAYFMRRYLAGLRGLCDGRQYATLEGPHGL